MDRLWHQSSLELNMICYDIMETGYQIGYIQFVQNSTVITQMHKDYGFWSGPFARETVLNHFLATQNSEKQREWRESLKDDRGQRWLKEYHEQYLHSLAG
jgi:hypothetical protein